LLNARPQMVVYLRSGRMPGKNDLKDGEDDADNEKFSFGHEASAPACLGRGSHGNPSA